MSCIVLVQSCNVCINHGFVPRNRGALLTLGVTVDSYQCHPTRKKTRSSLGGFWDHFLRGCLGSPFFGNRVTIFCSIAKRKLTQISGIDNDRRTRIVRSIVGKQWSAVAQSSWINLLTPIIISIAKEAAHTYVCRSISHIELWYCMTTPHLPLARTS